MIVGNGTGCLKASPVFDAFIAECSEEAYD